MASPAQYPFTGDGSRKIFPIPSKILGTDYIKIHIDDVAYLDTTGFDIINNSIVFKVAPASGAVLNIWVAEAVEDIANLGTTTNIDLVADSLTNINKVASFIPTINDISNISTSVTDTQLNAWIAEAEQMTADSYANQLGNVFVNVYTSNGDGTFTATPTTDYSSYHYSLVAEAEALTADSYATQVEDVFVNTYTSDGDGTFTATPTTDYSALHWSSKANTSALNADTASGLFTPTIVNPVNVSSSTFYECTWMRVGKVISVAGQILITPTATGLTSFSIVVPVLGKLTADYVAPGSFVILGDTTYETDKNYGTIYGTNLDRVLFRYSATSTVAQNLFFSFQYSIL